MNADHLLLFVSHTYIRTRSSWCCWCCFCYYFRLFRLFPLSVLGSRHALSTVDWLTLVCAVGFSRFTLVARMLRDFGLDKSSTNWMPRTSQRISVVGIGSKYVLRSASHFDLKRFFCFFSHFGEVLYKLKSFHGQRRSVRENYLFIHYLIEELKWIRVGLKWKFFLCIAIMPIINNWSKKVKKKKIFIELNFRPGKNTHLSDHKVAVKVES